MEEKIENCEITNNEESQILSQNVIKNLSRTALCMKIMSIFYYALSALMFIAVLFFLFDRRGLGLYNTPSVSDSGIVSKMMVVVMMVVTFCLGYYLEKMAKGYRSFAKNPQNSKPMEDTLHSQWLYWRLIVLTTAVPAGMMLLSLLIFIVSSTF